MKNLKKWYYSKDAGEREKIFELAMKLSFITSILLLVLFIILAIYVNYDVFIALIFFDVALLIFNPLIISYVYRKFNEEILINKKKEIEEETKQNRIKKLNKIVIEVEKLNKNKEIKPIINNFIKP